MFQVRVYALKPGEIATTDHVEWFPLESQAQRYAATVEAEDGMTCLVFDLETANRLANIDKGKGGRRA